MTREEAARVVPRCYRPWLRPAEEAGCTFVKRKAGVLIRGPEGGSTMLHGSPRTNGPSFENARLELRRLGVRI